MRLTLALALIASFVGFHEFQADPASIRGQIGRIVDKKCSSCHGGTSANGVDLSTEEKLRRRAADIGKVVMLEQMPPVQLRSDFPEFHTISNLTAAERLIFKDWSNAGGRIGDGPKWVLQRSLPHRSTDDFVQACGPSVPIPAEGGSVFREFEIGKAALDSVRGFRIDSDSTAGLREAILYVEKNGNRIPVMIWSPGAGLTGAWIKAPGERWILRVRFEPNGEASTGKFRVRLHRGKAGTPNTASSFRLSTGKTVTLPKQAAIQFILPDRTPAARTWRVVAEFPDGRRKLLMGANSWQPIWMHGYRYDSELVLPPQTKLTLETEPRDQDQLEISVVARR